MLRREKANGAEAKKRNKKKSTAILNDEEKSKFDVEIKVEEESPSALRIE